MRVLEKERASIFWLDVPLEVTHYCSALMWVLDSSFSAICRFTLSLLSLHEQGINKEHSCDCAGSAIAQIRKSKGLWGEEKQQEAMLRDTLGYKALLCKGEKTCFLQVSWLEELEKCGYSSVLDRSHGWHVSSVPIFSSLSPPAPPVPKSKASFSCTTLEAEKAGQGDWQAHGL